MEKIIKSEYWSKSEAFLVPLTQLSRSQRYPMMSYLYWGEHSIDNNQLIIKFDWEKYDEFINYCRKVIFPILDRNGLVIESYDFEQSSVLVIDLSQWTHDINMFLSGKYSKMTSEAKKLIKEYHRYYDKGPILPVYIHAALEPNIKFSTLGNLTAIEYLADNWGFDLEELKRLGEVVSLYDKKKETLLLDCDDLTESYLGNDICTYIENKTEINEK